MKFTSAVVGLLALSSGVLAKDDKKSKKKDEKEEPAPPVCPAPREVSIPKVIRPFEVVDLKHYLVGLLKFPAATIPPKLDKHTSGRKALPAPLGYVPNVGITHIEGLVDKTVEFDSKTGAKRFEFYKKKKGAFVVLKDEGYKSSDNSDDFALHYHLIQIQKPFVYNNGEATFKDEIYTPVILDDTLLISDPDKLIKWKSEWDGQNIDIQVTYGAPANWQDWKADRVLTGRDLSPEGIAVKTDACAVIAEKWGPSVFSIDIPTGKVTSPLVPVPDIWYNETHKYMYDDLFLSTTSDKRHCYLHEAQMNMCGSVPSSRVDSNGYFAYVADEDEDEDDKKKNKDKVKVFVPKFTRIPSDAGWAGLTLFPSGTAVGMFQQTLSGEPGPRIYEVDPGDCTSACPPKVKKFLGFYQLSHNANRIAAITAIAGSSDFVYTTEPGTVNPRAYGSNTRLLVKEHSSGFPDGDRFSPNHTGGMPADKLCIIWIDLDVVVQDDKICILNYMHIADPYDVDHNGLGVYAQSSFYNSGLVVTDDYCFIGGTDPDWPVDFDKFGLEEVAASVPFYTEAVEDTRFFIVCFYEPYFDEGYNWASQGVFFNDIRL